MSRPPIINLTSYSPYNGEEGVKRVFISVPEWHGGYGLAPAETPVKGRAIPETREGIKVETTLGQATEVRKHNCEYNYWGVFGYLVDGVLYTPIR